MNWLTQTLKSSIGLKVVMAVTGLMMVGFLVAHLSGNLLFFAGPTAINNYAVTLRQYLPVLWFLRLGLIAAVALHIWTAVELTRRNQAAKPHKYHVSNPREATLASRTMFLTGLVVLFFVLYHLAHFTFKWTHKEAFQGLDPFDVYAMLKISFGSPIVSLFYVISVLLLMFHLNHGVASIFQTLGINHSKYNGSIRWVSKAVSVVLALGFIAIPISINLGLTH